jgi:alpha-L-arabinofuranosidase
MKTTAVKIVSLALCIAITLFVSAAWAQDAAPDAGKNAATLTLHADQPGPVINRNIYGQFSEHLGRCIYEGIWVGENSPIPNTRGIRNDVVAALKAINVPVLRWPGGCFADEYHWKDGIGPREKRPKLINTHWGGVVENNHFGTHEFMDLCEQIGAEPCVCGNVGSGSVEEMMQWVEYMTSDADSPMANLRRQNGRNEPWKVKYFGVGNESWGCGGTMTPEFYSDQFRRYNTFVKNYSGNKIFRIACGASDSNYTWTEVLMKAAGRSDTEKSKPLMNGLSLHYYTLPTGNWQNKGSSTQFDESRWHATLRRTLEMDDLITKHSEIMDKYDPKKLVRLVVDEWGTWYDVEPGSNPGFLYQQNTLRDAIVAALNLHIFQRHADRVSMANIAQMINVLQAMILTDKAKMVLTPTYHVFEMFKVHQDGMFLPVELKTPDYTSGSNKIPAVSASASRDAKSDVVYLSLVNTNPREPVSVKCKLSGFQPKTVAGRVLTAPEMNSLNSFDAPNAVRPETFIGAQIEGDSLSLTLPPKSVVVLDLH